MVPALRRHTRRRRTSASCPTLARTAFASWYVETRCFAVRSRTVLEVPPQSKRLAGGARHCQTASRVLSSRARAECQTACKPGSVPGALASGDDHSSGTPVAGRLARPTRAAVRKPTCPARRPGAPLLLGLAPGGVYTAAPVAGTRGALLPHPFTLAGRRPAARAGGLLSVALSLGSPPPGVTRHRVSVEPGLSSPGAQSAPKAAIRPSGGTYLGPARAAVKPGGPRRRLCAGSDCDTICRSKGSRDSALGRGGAVIESGPPPRVDRCADGTLQRGCG